MSAMLDEFPAGRAAALVASFNAEVAVRAGALRRALEVSDREATRRAAHSLRGLSATFGAERLARLAQAIERDAAQGRPPDGMAAACLAPLVQATVAATRARITSA